PSAECGASGSFFPRRSQARREWSLQAVKGKVTTSCLWNACKALTLGTLLILIGAAMATIGYYAEEEELRRLAAKPGSSEPIVEPTSGTYVPLPPSFPDMHPHAPHLGVVASTNTSGSHRGGGYNPITKGGRPPPLQANHHAEDIASVDEGHIEKPEDIAPQQPPDEGGEVVPVYISSYIPYKDLGLNKLAYIGPIVMGFGGFVIVAACVMTFEARDSAAKIVPARFRKTFPEKPVEKDEDPGFRHSAAQTKWDPMAMHTADSYSSYNNKEFNRKAMTLAFIKFSKTFQKSVDSSAEYYDWKGVHHLIKCPSAPSLVPECLKEERRQAGIEAPRILRVCVPRPQSRRLSTNVLPRQTMSVDNPAIREVCTSALPSFAGERKCDEEMELGASATAVHQADSDSNLALDLHLPQCAVTLMVRDSSRSPIAKTHLDEEIPSIAESVPMTQSDSSRPSSYQAHFKVDKQTSTAENRELTSFGWSKETSGSRDAGFSSGGSFREPKRPHASRKVKRSETIDTASTHHRRHHNHHHHTSHHRHNSPHLQSSQRASSARSVAGRSPGDSLRHKLVSSRSETGRRHQLLRQSKFEASGSHEELKNQAPFNV
ncbi:uncharacterized protein LOC108674295, partial [Hyalella azteca]|uniref:Uncharacterized protein LOC108674295 n=1 Tax=Hyalella azteca TaxID=294128 RepID=A0A8B7NVC2_HYAAZ